MLCVLVCVSSSERERDFRAGEKRYSDGAVSLYACMFVVVCVYV